MKASELRIGNLIYSITGEIIPVAAHTLFDFYSYDYKPIPLTEEWLIKAEFEGSIQEGFMKDGFFIAYLTTEDNFEFEFRLPASDGWIIIPVKYVHKLQNLWFELKGEELTIKAESAK